MSIMGNIASSQRVLAMIVLKRIDHLVLTVKDVRETIDFYTKVLNMQEITINGKDFELKAVRFGDQRFLFS